MIFFNKLKKIYIKAFFLKFLVPLNECDSSDKWCTSSLSLTFFFFTFSTSFPILMHGFASNVVWMFVWIFLGLLKWNFSWNNGYICATLANSLKI